jgi:hypothetical protein
MIVIAGNPAIGTIGNDARPAAELIPDGGPFAIGARRAFDLKRAAGNTPGKRSWKPRTERS